MNLIRIRIQITDKGRDIKFFKITADELNQIKRTGIETNIELYGYYLLGKTEEYSQVIFDRDFDRKSPNINSSNYDEIANDIIPILREKSIDTILN